MNNESQNSEQPNQNGGHDVPLTPPPLDSTSTAPAASPPTSRPSRGGGARAGAIAIAAFGGIALLATGGTAAFAAVHNVVSSDRAGGGDTQTVSVDGVDSLDIDVAASDVKVRFGDVDEAILETTGARSSDWTMKRDGDELVVSNDDNAFGWFGGGFGSNWFNDDTQVVLTLPESLNETDMDAEFSLGAGRLDIEGMFGEVDIEMGAGALRMVGSATSIDADISAGRADLNLVGVTEADFTISAGKLVASISDTPPKLITFDVSAGSLELTVPDEAYDVSQEVSAGSLDNRLDTSTSSRYKIDATVSAGSAILREAD